MTAFFLRLGLALLAMAAVQAATPVTVTPVTGRQGMVVSGHPQASEVGLAVLRAGGSAVDAFVATSLAVGVAEPYGSGLGGKLALVYFEARTGRTYFLDAMDESGAGFDWARFRAAGEDASRYGYSSVCVPGLAAGLAEAHARWGTKPWADDVRPAADLARRGFQILAKSRDQFAEQEKKLRRGDAEIARLYLPGGKLPEVGSVLPNADLARTLDLLAAQGRDGFYRGPVAAAIVAASQQGGGCLSLEDFARYQARVTETVSMDFRGYRLVSAPPPTIGAALYFPTLKILETETFGGGPLRSAANLDLIGRVWGAVATRAWATIADVPDARARFEKLLSPESLRSIRAKALAVPATGKKAAWLGEDFKFENPLAATTHLVVVDAAGNIVCATQSQSLHFGAGVVAPGTGVVLNNSMSNFNFEDSSSVSYARGGRRPRSTIAPTIIFREGRPVLAIGIPGGARIPTAMLQVLLDHLALGRPLADAMGDTRMHFASSAQRDDVDTVEGERSFPATEAAALQTRGWKIVLPEEAGRGRHFGGMAAVALNPDGTLTGYADPRRTNAAAGW